MSLEAAIAAMARDAAESVMRDTRARFVSQKTSLELVGIPARNFVEWLREPGFPLPVVKRGRLRLIELEPLVAHLRSLASTPEKAAEPEAIDAADQVLAEIFPGCEPELKKTTRWETGRLQTLNPTLGKGSRTDEKLPQERKVGNR